MKPRIRHLIAALLGLPLLWADGAAAASGTCERLRAELASLPRTVADTGAARKYAGAIASQNIQLRKARSDMGRFGCGSRSVTIVGNRNAQACATLASAVERMERNLKILDDKRRQHAGSQKGERARLLAALDARGCNGKETATVVQAAAKGAEGVRVFGNGRTSGLPGGVTPEGDTQVGLVALRGTGQGNLRTVCVRTCDGGFFPISSGASPRDFRRDQQVCAMMCPQTETELFYDALTGATDTADMTSTVTGRPYSALENAFAYRIRDLSKPAACGCDLTAYYQEMLRREQTLQATREAKVGGAAVKQPDTSSVIDIRLEPRDTLSIEGAVTGRPVTREPGERDYDPASGKVRRVGPVFLPAEDTALDLGGG